MSGKAGVDLTDTLILPDMPSLSQAENAVFRNGGALSHAAAPFRRVFGPGGESYAC